ncbi:ABC transporter substrate-binding protein [Homoserinibacter sp. YIM 151385]|uniref:ABC transporter substrate-binding protein n=1 Tax=Homoserinibacter sp. YIM 151385 TaxID=2985506 RepID=UPI0022F01FD6|nr:ABC transporter substrate-binding protein [Homoserinibacter sp. YIM 151385]WBU37898.1 ABC transporter substrate-binding protein [Homoserinibacter sp. YIM 151385]
MSGTRRIAAAALAAGTALVLSSCAGAPQGQGPGGTTEDGLDRLPIRLNWTYEAADHPWFFAGMVQGIYAEHGIELDPLEGTGSASTLQLVASGSDPVGLVDAGTMMGGVAKGLPVQMACVLAQKNPMAAIFPADAGISSIDDLRGETVAVTPGDSLSQIFPAVLSANGMTEKDLDLVGLSDPAAKQNSVLTGASTAFLGYYTLQLPALEISSGEEMDYLSFSELGVDTLSMGIVVNTAWAAQNEDLLTRFIQATQESAEYVAENQEAAADDFVEGVPGFDRDLALTQIEATVPLLHTEASEGLPVCETTEEDWQATEEILAEYSGLTPAESVDAYYTNDYATAE